MDTLSQSLLVHIKDQIVAGNLDLREFAWQIVDKYGDEAQFFQNFLDQCEDYPRPEKRILYSEKFLKELDDLHYSYIERMKDRFLDEVNKLIDFK